MNNNYYYDNIRKSVLKSTKGAPEFGRGSLKTRSKSG